MTEVREQYSHGRAVLFAKEQETVCNELGSNAKAEALGDIDKILDSHRKDFWGFQNRVNSSGAQAPTYLDVCRVLSLDAQKPSIITSVEGTGDSEECARIAGTMGRLGVQHNDALWERRFQSSREER